MKFLGPKEGHRIPASTLAVQGAMNLPLLVAVLGDLLLRDSATFSTSAVRFMADLEVLEGKVTMSCNFMR